MKFLFIVSLSLLTSFAQADGWPSYNYLGKCVSESDEGKIVMEFFSQPLKVNAKKMSGFISIRLETSDEDEVLGAYDATFKLIVGPSSDSVEVTSNNSILEIPFGKNVVIKDNNGQESLCTTEQ